MAQAQGYCRSGATSLCRAALGVDVRLWWGTLRPSGLACLEPNGSIYRMPLAGDPVMLAARPDRVYALVDGAHGHDLREIPV
jgi:hypothetical protein